MNTPLVMDLTNIHCLLIWSHLVEKDDIQLQRHVHKYNSAIKCTIANLLIVVQKGITNFQWLLSWLLHK